MSRKFVTSIIHHNHKLSDLIFNLLTTPAYIFDAVLSKSQLIKFHCMFYI